jgi:uroporphyrinogen-III synthase
VTAALEGFTVVVTRPARQAGPFVAMLRDAGADPILLPTIEIEPIELDAASRAALAPDDFDWTVYTSANAVECSLQQLPRPARTRVAAIGHATARALGEQGIRVDAVPQAASDSEGLLALGAFTDLRGQRVLIVKGAGGRTLLRAELARRGADVVLCEVYRRRPAAADPAALEALQKASGHTRLIVVVTSGEVLSALLEATPDGRLPKLRDSTLLVPGERVAASARSLGWRGPLVVAPSAEDGVMFATLARHSSCAGPFGGA